MKVEGAELKKARMDLQTLKYCAKVPNQVKESEIAYFERKIKGLERLITIGIILK
jgi:hypothetical protein